MGTSGSQQPPPAKSTGASQAHQSLVALLVLVAGGIVAWSGADRLPSERATTEKPRGAPPRVAGGKTSAAAKGSASVTPSSLTPPPPKSTASTAASERPRQGCDIPDKGWGAYAPPWRAVGIRSAKAMLPTQMPEAHYQLLVHFHGRTAVRKLLAPAGLNLVLVGVDVGTRSKAYEKAFSEKATAQALIDGVDRLMAPAKRQRLILSAWSAGYGAVRAWLRHSAAEVNDVVLLDALHAQFDPGTDNLAADDVSPFLAFAERARSSPHAFVLTHSEISPPGYASTKRVAQFLIESLGGQARYAGLSAHGLLRQKTAFNEGRLAIRGYTGSDRQAHCAHLSLLPAIVASDLKIASKTD